MKKIIVIILFIVSSNLYGQSTWFWQNPYPTGEHLNNVYFPVSSVGYICGNNGVVLKSSNYGGNWFYAKIGINQNDLFNIHFSDEYTGYTLGGGTLYRTIDGANSWQSVLDNSNFKDVYCLNRDSIFIVNSLGNLLRSYNGGQNFINVSENVSKVIFINSNTGIHTGKYIKKSSNGGLNWYSVTAPDSNYTQICIIDEDKGFAISKKSVIRSTNVGDSWQKIYTDSSTSLEFIDVFFTSYNTGYITTSSSVILKTTNAGVNWNTTPGISGNIAFPTDSISLIPSKYGSIFRSTDFANLWSNISRIIENNYFFRKLSFPTQSTGYIMSGDAIVNRQELFKTTNTGITWFDISPINVGGLGFISIDFVNGDSGFIYDIRGVLFKTTNGGKLWDSLRISPFTAIDQSIEFLDVNTGFVTNYSTVKKTTNGGLNWQIITVSGGNEDAVQIYFLNHYTGFIVSRWKSVIPPYPQRSLISKTTNSGNTWDTLSFLPNIYVNDIFFKNDSIGFLCDNMAIYMTTSGGDSWQIVNNNGSKSITFTDNGYGYIPGYKSTNGGLNWFHNPYYAYQSSWWEPFDIKFFNDNTGFIIGNGSLIIKTTDGGGTINVSNISTTVPSSFYLRQNYPNPFNPSTSIKFDIPKGALVKLKIYDMLGREVAELVNERLNAGVYEYEWSAAGLPSGVYFYRLQAGEYVETRRMVLVK